jgi:arginase
MDIRLVTTESVAGTASANLDPKRVAGMARAGSALLTRQTIDRLGDAGARVDGVAAVSMQLRPNADPITGLALINAQLAEAVADALRKGIAPVLVGGNCSHTIGMIAGIQAAQGITTRLGLLWLDAHGDFNTPRTSHSGMLGGMPVAVAAGLCWPQWREGAGQQVPLPTNRIVMVDVRNLDLEEEALIRATDVEVVRFGNDFEIGSIAAAIDRLAVDCDQIYVHVDADILDESLQPNHPTVEPNGPLLKPVVAVLKHAFGTGKVCAFAVVSVNATGEQGPISVASGTELLVEGVRSWVGNRAS